MRLHRSQLRAITPAIAAGEVPTIPPPPVRRKRDNEEWRIQSNFFTWWRASARSFNIWPGCCYHVPNGSMLGDDAKSRAIRAKMLKQAGVVGGVVDVFLAVPRGGLPGCYVEFKKPSLRDTKDGGLSPAQQEFISYMLAHGYRCVVCYSWEEGRDAVTNYLDQKPAYHHD